MPVHRTANGRDGSTTFTYVLLLAAAVSRQIFDERPAQTGYNSTAVQQYTALSLSEIFPNVSKQGLEGSRAGSEENERKADTHRTSRRANHLFVDFFARKLYGFVFVRGK